MRLPYSILLLVLTAALLQCTPTVDFNRALIDRLKNRGPLALSTDNPYLAANLFLAKEIEKSSTVRGFIDHRGAPPVISVEKELFSPIILEFYYPKNLEYYVLESRGSDWLIGGPYPLSGETMNEVGSLAQNLDGAPALKPERAGAWHKGPAPLSDEVRKNLEDSPREASLEERSPIIGSVDEGQLPFQSPAKGRADFAPHPESGSGSPNNDLELIVKRYGKHPAELTPKGDLVHYVTYPGETLSMISRWYTLDETNTLRLARINSLPDPNTLSTGDTLIIPKYLVKNNFRLTEEAVEALKTFALQKLGH
jgi:hypothetical protein